eukprot:XP_001690438.1 predicted protein [Chlamydomonas reinhardtii]
MHAAQRRLTAVSGMFARSLLGRGTAWLWLDVPMCVLEGTGQGMLAATSGHDRCRAAA